MDISMRIPYLLIGLVKRNTLNKKVIRIYTYEKSVKLLANINRSYCFLLNCIIFVWAVGKTIYKTTFI